MSATGFAPAVRRALRFQSLITGTPIMKLDKPAHEPVMVEEVLAALNIKPGDTVVDGTVGLGGHSAVFAELVGPKGLLIGFDWDAGMLRQAKAKLKGAKCKIELHQDSFKNWGGVIGDRKVNGVLLDLGLNSAQVDDPQRGFSFQHDAPLDMRMDQSRGEPASALLNRLAPGQIEDILRDFGDERWARAIARRIVDRRKERPIRTTGDLNQCVFGAIPPSKRDPRIHASTRTFQALRIAVNGELDGLDDALYSAAESLHEGGTLAVLSYHSGEDRIAKRVFRDLSDSGFEELTRKPVEPSEDEVRRNPRSRSAKLRALRRITSGSKVQGREL